MKTQQYLESHKYSSLIFVACFAAYSASYVGRINFSAALADIVSNGLFTKSEAGIIGSAFFFVYGAFQIINGFLGDKLSPFKMIIAGTFLSGVANIGMTFCTSNISMAVVWGFNGFSLSLLWAAILKILANIINEDMRSKACRNISITLPIGTILAYLLASLSIKFFDWKYVFYIPAVILIVVCAFFTVSYLVVKPHIKEIPLEATATPKKSKKAKSNKSIMALLAVAGVLVILPADAIHGAIKEGITTWVPTMISELYSTDASFSVFLSVLLPVFNLSGVYIITPIYNRLKKNELKTGVLILLFALIPLTSLIFINKLPIILSVALLAIITTAMHSFNYMIITLVPMRFAYCGRTATVTGIMNATAYVGCAAASYGFGVISDAIGWNGTILVWLGMALVAALITAIPLRKWKKFIQGANSQ